MGTAYWMGLGTNCERCNKIIQLCSADIINPLIVLRLAWIYDGPPADMALYLCSLIYGHHGVCSTFNAASHSTFTECHFPIANCRAIIQYIYFNGLHANCALCSILSLIAKCNWLAKAIKIEKKKWKTTSLATTIWQLGRFFNSNNMLPITQSTRNKFRFYFHIHANIQIWFVKRPLHSVFSP